MKIYIILCFAIISFQSSSFAQQINDTIPVKISSIVIAGTSDNICPSQGDINVKLTSTKDEIREALTNNQNNLSPGSCSGTGWSRVAFLNMTDPSEVCPSNLTLLSSPVRGCGRQLPGSDTCDSVILTLTERSYTHVCGKILAYQKGATDAFRPAVARGRTGIETNYVDGISLTLGPAFSRQHIWTFAAAIYEQDSTYVSSWNCACTNTQQNWPYQVPTFIGNNYFCDTGNAGPRFSLSAYYPDDPLWDGKGCGPNNACCQLNNPPWFQTTLPQTTSDDIELRMCHGDAANNQDTILYLIDIYVK